MIKRTLAGGGLAIAMLVAVASFAASAQASVTRTAAAKAALKAFKVDSDARAVRVLGLLRQIAPRTAVTESVQSGRARTDRRTGVTSAPAKHVLVTPGEPVWFFYADRGPHQGFEHPGQVALVGARSGKVTLSRALDWVPLIAGRLPEFFASSDGYEGSRFVVFDRPWPSTGSAASAPATPARDGEAEQRAAAALAAQRACVLRYSDTLGDFFDFGHVDQTRAELGRFFLRLSRDAPAFVTQRYMPKQGTTPIAAAQRMIDRYGCRDMTLYAAGAGTRSHPDAVMIGLRASSGAISTQTITAAAVRALMRANPNVSFKIILDAPYTGGFAPVLRGEHNLAVLLASGGPTQASFAYLPSITGPGGVVLNPGNPQHLLQFTNALIDGLELFAASRAEVDNGIAHTETTFMAWMLARALNLAGSPFGAGLFTPVVIVPGTTPPPASPIDATPVPRVNHAPAGATAAQTTREDTPLDITLDGSDADGDPLTFAIVTPPAHGALDGAGPRVTYTPAGDFNGADAFSYTVSDGVSTSAPITVTITVDPVDDPPVLTASAGSASYTEQAAPVAIDPGIVLRDVDSATVDGATVSLPAGVDELHFTDQHGIAGTFAGGVLTLTGTASLADYQAALRSVTFSTPGDDPSTAPRTVTFRAGNGAAATRVVHVLAVDDPPVLTASAGAVSYTENDPPVLVDPGLTVGDPDSAQLTGATVTIGGGPSTDLLHFADQHGITGTFAGNVLRLSGAATVADYQAALRSIAFEAAGDDPTGAPRTISFAVDDGAAPSNTVQRDVAVTPVDDQPTVTTTPGTAAWTEAAAPTAVDPDLTVSDPDSAQLVSAKIQIASGGQDGDLLSALPTGTLSGAYDAASRTLTITGSAPLATYRTILRTVAFSNSTNHPGQATRHITFTVDDGALDSALASRDVAVTDVNSAPVVTTSAGATSYTEDAPPVAIDAALTVTDADDDSLRSATVTITPHAAEDALAFSDTASIHGAYDTATGVLTLTGTDSVARYQDALRSVTYADSSENPATAARTVSFRASDGTDTSAAATKTVGVLAVDDPPRVVTSGGATNFTENGGPVAVDGAIAVSDPDDATLQGATVTITDGEASDVLSFTDTASIHGSFASGTLTLTGADTVANYRAALASVTYADTSANPSTADRTITFAATDGTAASAPASKTVQVRAVDNPPALTQPDATLAYTEGDGTTAIAPNLTASDPDDARLASATVKITAGYVAGEDALHFSDQNGITGTVNGATLTLTGSATVADYQAALRSVGYANSSANPDTGTRTVAFTAGDGTLTSDAVTRAITVARVDSPPVPADHSYTAIGNTALVVDDPADGAPDPAGPQKTVTDSILAGATDADDATSTLTVVPGTITTADGGTVTMEPDGDFTYLPKAGCAASDHFSYGVQDPEGRTGTATITIAASGCVWYVKAGAGGDGTSSAPAGSPGALATAAGQTIFLYGGTYGAITLADGQQLIGQSVGLTVGGIALEPATGANPTVGATTLAKNDTVHGITFGAGVTGTSVGTFTVDHSSIDAGGLTVGGAGNTLDAAWDSVTGPVSLAGAAGSLRVASGDLDGLTITGSSLNSTLGAQIDDKVTLTSDTGATDLTGRLALTSAFTAVNGGTVTATGTGSTDTGTVDIDTTTIGAAGVTFRSVSHTGSAPSIVLAHTGAAGSFEVSGDGSTCTAATPTCDGGTLASTNSFGISLTDTLKPSFSEMKLQSNAAGGAILATSVSGLTLADSVVSGGDTALSLSEVTGAVALTGDDAGGAATNELRLRNSAGTLDRLTISGSTIHDAGDDLVNVGATNSSTVNVTIDSSTLKATPTDLLQTAIDGTGGGDVKLTNSTLTGSGSIVAGGGGATIEAGQNGPATVTVQGNTSSGADGSALLISKDDGSGTLTGAVKQNVVGTAAAVNSGSLDGNGIEVLDGGGTVTMDVSGNTVRRYNGDGIHLAAGSGDPATGTATFSIAGNHVFEPGTTTGLAPHAGLLVQSGTGQDSLVTCVNLGAANQIAGSGAHGGPDYAFRQRPNATFKLVGYTGGAFDQTAIDNFLATALGTSTGTASIGLPGGGFVGATTC